MINFLENKKETLEAFHADKILISAGTVHAIFAIFMLINDVPYSFLTNIMLASLYFFSLVFFKMNSFNKCILSIFILVSIHVVTAMFFFGYGYGYDYILLPILAYCYMGIYENKHTPYLIGAIGVMLYILMLYLFLYDDFSLGYELYLDKNKAQFIISLFNAIFISLVFIVVSIGIRRQKNSSLEKKQKLNKLLQQNIGIDLLTKLKTRWYFLENLKNIDNFDETTMILIDIDKFKQINKNYGYEIGDEVLFECGNFIKSHFSEYTNLICRWGGGEFLIVGNNKNSGEFLKLCESFLNDFEDSILASLKVKLNASIGMLHIENDFRINLLDEYIVRLESNVKKAKTYSREKIVISNM